MSYDVVGLASRLEQASTIKERLDFACQPLVDIGFSAFIYDYSPVPLSLEGRIIAPTLVELKNVPDDFAALWLKHGYVQIDPVQVLAINSSIPFVWSLLNGGNRLLRSVVKPDHAPALAYLRESRMTCGVTVPIHLPDGDLASFTAIKIDPERNFESDATRYLGDVSLIGSFFSSAVYSTLDSRTRTCQQMRLTMRERECLRLCARGLSSKQIAHRVGRSVATVTLHIGNALRKLGAKNRPQAVAHAAYYRLLDED
jgi:LuxR family transcriptional regulator, quorum-sensing system regulator SdiA